MNRLPTITGLAVLSVAALAQTRPAATEPPSVAARDVRPSAGAEYAGSERCGTCHEAELRQFQKTPHAMLKPAIAGSVIGCEMCHGPGKAHAEAQEGGKPDSTSAAGKLRYAFQGNPQQRAEPCLHCHNTSRDQREFSRSTHARHGVDCASCHSMHLVEAAQNPKSTLRASAQAAFFSVPKLAEGVRWANNSLLRKSQPDLCAACHGNILAQFALPTHHRVPEGAMKCTDCHNTHGTSNRATLRQSGWETCIQCHTEKRGPFVFEHSAVKVEGCIACHTPHGSVNRMLLVRREERFLCLSCHVDPAAANVPHGRLGLQTRGDCTRCHSSIHGSNFDVNFLH
jgi:predicted CXXCH cytochrome family protein